MKKGIWISEENIKAVNEELKEELKKYEDGQPNKFEIMFELMNDLGIARI